MNYYICQVCGYDRLMKPATDHNICPCCGTEFGYDDIAHTWEELRNLWIARGAKWFSHHTPAPNDWNVVSQLSRFTRQHVTSSARVEIVNLPMPFADDTFLKDQTVRQAVHLQNDA
jgi:hypothetical protein